MTLHAQITQTPSTSPRFTCGKCKKAVFPGKILPNPLAFPEKHGMMQSERAKMLHIIFEKSQKK